MALILCIETGTDICSVALALDGEVLALKQSSGSQDHARNLALYIESVIKDSGYTPSDLDAVAVSEGPGSYTGLRIGVSTAKGICYALGIPLIGVSSTISLARQAVVQLLQEGYELENTLLCPMIDARRMEVYAQVFDSGLRSLTDIGAHIVDQQTFNEYIESGKEFFIFGNGAEKCIGILPQKVKFMDIQPSATGLIVDAFDRFHCGKFEDTAYFEPFYLKDFVVTTSTKKLL